MNGYSSPDLPDGPERYVDAYRYIHDHFIKNGADNVLWVWSPNAPFEVMERSLGSWNNAAAYYPGDDYVDWLCFDGYNWGSSAFGQQFNAKWTSFDEIFASSYTELQAINSEKPIIIGEFASTEEGGDKAAWIRTHSVLFVINIRKYEPSSGFTSPKRLTGESILPKLL